jgi:putative thioredoxin
MMASDDIINVSEADFEYQVVAYSQQVPVIVDFWAEWCGPCKILGPMLEKFAQEAQGGFRLAKVDVDANPGLAMQFNIQSIPSVKAFVGGKMVAEFSGVLPELKVREFLSGLTPSQDGLMLEKAFSLLNLQQPKSAERAFRKVLETSPGNTPALLGLAKSLLLQGNAGDGQLLLRNFPASKEFISAEKLRPLAEALREIDEEVDLDSDDPLKAAYTNSLLLVKRGNTPAAIDGLLEILRQDKRYRGGKVRQVIIGLLELLGENDPMARQYRNELASVLF